MHYAAVSKYAWNVYLCCSDIFTDKTLKFEAVFISNSFCKN